MFEAESSAAHAKSPHCLGRVCVIQSTTRYQLYAHVASKTVAGKLLKAFYYGTPQLYLSFRRNHRKSRYYRGSMIHVAPHGLDAQLKSCAWVGALAMLLNRTAKANHSIEIRISTTALSDFVVRIRFVQ